MNVVVFLLASSATLYADDAQIEPEYKKFSDMLQLNAALDVRTKDCNGLRVLDCGKDQLWWRDDSIPDEKEFNALANLFPPGCKVYVAGHQSRIQGRSAEIKKELGARIHTPPAEIIYAGYCHEPHPAPIWPTFSTLVTLLMNKAPDEATMPLFGVLMKQINQESLTRKLSNIKHQLAKQFLPIDIDLQGLCETGFDVEYWRSVTSAYGECPVEMRLQQATKLVRGDEDSLSEVVDLVKGAWPGQKRRINASWAEVEACFDASGSELYNEARQVLKCLAEPEERIAIQRMLEDRNVFHDWFAQLMNSVDSLRSIISELENPV